MFNVMRAAYCTNMERAAVRGNFEAGFAYLCMASVLGQAKASAALEACYKCLQTHGDYPGYRRNRADFVQFCLSLLVAWRSKSYAADVQVWAALMIAFAGDEAGTGTELWDAGAHEHMLRSIQAYWRSVAVTEVMQLAAFMCSESHSHRCVCLV